MPRGLHPYIKYNRRSKTYSVYAPIEGLLKVVARVSSMSKAEEIRDQAIRGYINTTLYPNQIIDTNFTRTNHESTNTTSN